MSPPDKSLSRGTSPEGLRRGTVKDLPAVAAIHRAAFFHAMPHMPVLHTPEEDLAFYSTVVFPRDEIWLAEESGMIAGFIVLRPGWVEHLYIHPDHQSRGHGGRLLGMALRGAEKTIRLWTFKVNTGARRFYEAHGFQIERETDGSGNEEKQPDLLYCRTRQPVPGGPTGIN
jgi:putative acetyltransferase